MMAYLPIGKSKISNMLEILRPGGEKFYDKFIENDEFSFEDHQKIDIAENAVEMRAFL